MTTKTITITEKAYMKLATLRLSDESFSDAINRLSEAKGSIKDCVGLWKDLSKREKETIEDLMKTGRQTTQNILRKLHGNTT